MQKLDPAHDSGSDHHHGEGGEEQRKNFPDSPGPSLFEKSHQTVRVAEGKPDDQEIEDQAEHRRNIAVRIDGDQKQGEHTWPDDQRNSDGDDPDRLLGKSPGPFGKDQINHGNDKKENSSCHLEIGDRDIEQSKDGLAHQKETDADQKGGQNRLTDDAFSFGWIHLQRERNKDRQDPHYIEGNEERNKREKELQGNQVFQKCAHPFHNNPVRSYAIRSASTSM
jgi:hypothetical protein